MTDSWLAARDIGTEATPIVRIMGGTYFRFAIGLILTLVNGPDGRRTFFNALAGRSSSHARHPVACPPHGGLPVSAAGLDTLFQDVIAVSVLTALLLVGYFRLRSRL